MRTIIDIGEKELKILDRCSKRTNLSRAELIRRAIRAFIQDIGSAEEGAAFGCWKGKRKTADNYLQKIRSEWNE